MKYFGEAAQLLFDRGYRQISRKHRIVARVDISPSELREFFIKRNFGRLNSGIPSLSLKDQEDYYRRCHSENRMTVPEDILNQLRRISDERR